MRIAILIIDASIAFKWLVAEPDSSAAIAWIGRTELLAPALIHAEVANALWKRVRKGELVPDGAPEQIEKLAGIVSTVDEIPMLGRALELAVELRHPVYDCVYLAVAEAHDHELLTADRRFLNAVRVGRYAERVRPLGS